jgi:hypothetical protein
MSKLLIGIHGRPHSGKDTVADYLVDKYGFSKFGPSFPVKATAAAMFDVDIECFYDLNIKETIDPFWNISYREMAQKVGKESSRDVFGEDIWMRHVEKRLLDDTADNIGIVLADIRYPNEAEWVRAHGGKVLFITRSDNLRGYVANSTHPCEHGLDFSLADWSIQNDGTIHALFENVDWLLEMNKNENKR